MNKIPATKKVPWWNKFKFCFIVKCFQNTSLPRNNEILVLKWNTLTVNVKYFQQNRDKEKVKISGRKHITQKRDIPKLRHEIAKTELCIGQESNSGFVHGRQEFYTESGRLEWIMLPPQSSWFDNLSLS